MLMNERVLSRPRLPTIDDVDMLREACRLMQHSAAVMGWMLDVYQREVTSVSSAMQFVQMMGQGFASSKQCSTKVVMAMGGLAPSDLLVTQFESEGTLRPAYMVVRDPVLRAIVVAVRGTMSISDLATDIAAHAEPFLDGYAHCGMAHSVDALDKVVRPVLRDALRANTGYRVVCTGHSLGAGCASLLCMKLTDEFDVSAFVFGCPPVCNLALARRFADRIQTVALRNDFITRLSLFTAHDVMTRARKATEASRLERWSKVKQAFGDMGSDVARAMRLSLRPGEVADVSAATHGALPAQLAVHPMYTGLTEAAQRRVAATSGEYGRPPTTDAFIKSIAREHERSIHLVHLNREVSVPSRASFVVRMGVAPGHVVSWTFRTVSNDIGFRVIFVPSDGSELDELAVVEETVRRDQKPAQPPAYARVPLSANSGAGKPTGGAVAADHDYGRVPAHDKAQEGNFVVGVRGTISLLFDNMYSVLMSKTLHLTVRLDDEVRLRELNERLATLRHGGAARSTSSAESASGSLALPRPSEVYNSGAPMDMSSIALSAELLAARENVEGGYVSGEVSLDGSSSSGVNPAAADGSEPVDGAAAAAATGSRDSRGGAGDGDDELVGVESPSGPVPGGPAASEAGAGATRGAGADDDDEAHHANDEHLVDLVGSPPQALLSRTSSVHHLVKPLYLPGRVYFLFGSRPHGSMSTKPRDLAWTMHTVDANTLGRVYLSDDMLWDHFPDVYVEALEQVRRKLEPAVVDGAAPDTPTV